MKYAHALIALNSLFLVALQSQIASASTLSTTLYDGTGLPEENTPQWLAPGGIDSNGFPVTSFTATTVSDGVTVKTDGIDASSDTAGYLGYSNYTANLLNPSELVLVNPAFPVLNADLGYSVFFEVGVNPLLPPETDPNRASFSVVAISSDTSKGIELDFEEDLIFAQSDTVNSSGFSEFTRAETSDVDADIDPSMVNSYELRVNSSTYELFVNGDTTAFVTGNLRDYEYDTTRTDPPLPFNPYETKNFLFFGDLTDRAAGSFTLGEVRVETPTASTPEFNFTFALTLLGIGMAAKRVISSKL